MKLDLTKPIRFRLDGKKRAYVGPVPDGTHIFAYLDEDGTWIPQRPISAGRADELYENVPDRKERWVNLYRGYTGATLYVSEKEATDHATSNCIGLIKITYEGDTPVAVELL